MKELSFEKMEEVKGGDYCDLICYWFQGGSGYQGDEWDLIFAWIDYCQGQC